MRRPPLPPPRRGRPLPREARPQGGQGQRLFKDGSQLDDAKCLVELKIENDDVLALTLQQPGGVPRSCPAVRWDRFALLWARVMATGLWPPACSSADGAWEEIAIDDADNEGEDGG